MYLIFAEFFIVGFTFYIFITGFRINTVYTLILPFQTNITLCLKLKIFIFLRIEKTD